MITRDKIQIFALAVLIVAFVWRETTRKAPAGSQLPAPPQWVVVDTITLRVDTLNQWDFDYFYPQVRRIRVVIESTRTDK